jgi:hypothetical protein
MKTIVALGLAAILAPSINVLFVQSSRSDVTFDIVQKYSKADTAKYQKSCKAETKKMLLQTPDSKGEISASEMFLDDCYRALESRQNGKGKVSQCISNFRAYARFYYRNTMHSKKELSDCAKLYR